MNPEQNRASVPAETLAGAESMHPLPELSPANPEVHQNQDRQEKEASHIATDASKTSLPPVATQPVVQANDQSPASVTATAPSTAKDTERIEKEWSQKIKQTLSETKGDPYNKEEGIKALRADYMYKRYGRKIGDSN
ncbi:hypothetical protein FWF48_01735 [Candidatus Saccharibacteria bacterium]|nr:hypothetical protein [Candidatus Saccharibacteria bacterium]